MTLIYIIILISKSVNSYVKCDSNNYNPHHFQDTLLDAAADIIGGAADGVADFANGVFGLFGEEELETRGRGGRKKNGGGRRNRRPKQPVPEPDDDPVRVTYHYIYRSLKSEQLLAYNILICFTRNPLYFYTIY